jgi:hypothetical protein
VLRLDPAIPLGHPEESRDWRMLGLAATKTCDWQENETMGLRVAG